jgi:FdhD protein
MADIELMRIDADGKRKVHDIVTDEIPLTMELNGEELVTLLCSPDNLKELCLGFLFSGGVIASCDEVAAITIDNQNWIAHIELRTTNDAERLMFKRLYTSGCGRGTLFYNALDRMHEKTNTSTMTLSADTVRALVQSFQEMSVAFKETGGVHSAAMSNGDSLVIFKEDIGRHNALDKVIGAALMQQIPMSNTAFLTSGRISSEIMFKAQKTGCPIVISRSAPTNQAVALAERWHLTLVGFVRGKRMNVYAAGERIV